MDKKIKNKLIKKILRMEKIWETFGKQMGHEMKEIFL